MIGKSTLARLPGTAPAVDPRPAYALSVDELRELVRAEVAGLAGSEPEPPALLDRRGLAAALGCCVDVVDKLRGEGMPEIRLIDVPRFELDVVLVWLRARSADA